jgi:hypothetical protein
MKTFITVIFSITFFIVSCDQQKSKESIYIDSEKVFDEAIEIHDEIMPLMGDIMKLQSTLKENKKSISDEETIQKINVSLQYLEDAHSSMMDWMRNLTQIPEQADVDMDAADFISSEDMLKIQEQSLKDVKKVKTAILESIDQAESLIDEL